MWQALWTGTMPYSWSWHLTYFKVKFVAIWGIAICLYIFWFWSTFCCIYRFQHKSPEDPSEVPGGFLSDVNKVFIRHYFISHASGIYHKIIYIYWVACTNWFRGLECHFPIAWEKWNGKFKFSLHLPIWKVNIHAWIFLEGLLRDEIKQW